MCRPTSGRRCNERHRAWPRLNLAALAALVLGVVGCVVGGLIDPRRFSAPGCAPICSGSACRSAASPWCWCTI